MTRFADLFAPLQGVALDNAVESPTPRPVAEALAAFAARMAILPSWVRDLDELPAQVASAIGRLFGVPAEWVVLATSTTEGISVIARSIALDPASRVVIPANEYPATVAPWLVQERAGGARVSRLACEVFAGPTSSELVAEIERPETSAVCLSAIGWQGVRHDLAAVAPACAERVALLVIDGSQATGAVPLAVRGLHGACLSTTFSKWAFGPEGVAAVVIPDTVRRRMSRPIEIVDFDPERPLAFEHRLPATFHAGIPATIALAGVLAGLALVEQLGVSTIEAHGVSLAASARERLRAMGCWVGTASSAIVCFRPPRVADLAHLHRHLRERGLFLSLREGALRASFHIHNDAGHVDRLCNALRDVLS